ncbi:hypothetical protein [Streptomyces sp. NPDC048650]|uniref:hypothetical protein n=1 Tax=unclassified Streptomyces TaxID=2593676 RepID=UPI00371AB268
MTWCRAASARAASSPRPNIGLGAVCRVTAEHQGERLRDWLDAARQDNVPSLYTLATGTDRDRDAVIAGLTLPWKSGVVGGHVNWIKMFKREMFGRADLDRLRKPVLVAR